MQKHIMATNKSDKHDEQENRPLFSKSKKPVSDLVESKKTILDTSDKLGHDENGSKSKSRQDETRPNDKKASEFSSTDKEKMEDKDTCGRERLKRHRVEMAGRVWIPDIWGQEDLLKDWIDCTRFDASLVNKNIMSARDSLAEEGRRADSSRLRIENSC